MSRASKYLLAIGGLTMAVTVVATALIVPLWIPSVIIGIVGMLWSELMLFGGLIVIDRYACRASAAFNRGGCSTVVTVCAALAFALSLGFMGMPLLFVGLFVALQLVILLALLALCGLLTLFGRQAKDADDAAAAQVAAFAGRAERIEEATAACTDPRVRQALASLTEAIRFADWGVTVPEDAEIDAGLVRLIEAAETGDIAAAVQTAHELEAIIDQRDAHTRALRRGGI